MNFFRKVQYLANRPWFSYLTIFLLQLKVIWGIWNYRDLTSGDTSSYFCGASLWFEKWMVNIIWSPLYTAFFGSMLHIANDSYAATILHRVIIIFAATLLVLCLMRKLLPAPLAWLVAAWWAVLPINFDCLYEVHLFAVLPVVSAWLLIGGKSSPWRRGGAIAVLFASTVLVRNELSVATTILGLICLAWEFQQWKVSGAPLAGRIRTLLPGYGVPMLLAVAICGLFFSLSTIPLRKLRKASGPKHTLNMAQVYAFGYQQRHSEWKLNPWTESDVLMKRDFGAPLVSLGDMIKRNPRAIFENMLWNVSLVPNGLQVLLFNSAAGSVNPDYAPVVLHSTRALVLSILVGGVLILGLALLYRERSYWWNSWLKDRMFYWLAMLSVAAVATLVIPTQRPRPSYLFTLGIFLMALVGMSVFVISRRWPALARCSKMAPALMILLPILVPSYYLQLHRIPYRPLLGMYRHLAPFEELLADPSTKLLVEGYSFEILAYIVHNGSGGDPSRVVNYGILEKMPKTMPLETFLAQEAINLVYVSADTWHSLEGDPRCRNFLESPEAFGWEKLAYERTFSGRWMLLRKKVEIQDDPVLLRRLNNSDDIVPSGDIRQLRKFGLLPADGILLGSGWNGLEIYGERKFRWVNHDAEIVITNPSGKKGKLLLDIEQGPGAGAHGLQLDVIDGADRQIAVFNVQGRMTVPLEIPGHPDRGFTLRLHVDVGDQPDAETKPIIRGFRAFGFRWE